MTKEKPYSFTFKTILGIKPSIYVPTIFLILIVSLILLLSSFFKILFREVTTIISWPTNAVVYVDDKIMGYTPLNLKLNSNSIITVKKEGFLETSISYTDNKTKLFFQLRNTDYPILEKSYKNASDWSLMSPEDISIRYRLPNLFSEDISDALYANEQSDIIDNYLESSLKLITNPFILSDYLRALVITKSETKMLSSKTIMESVRFIDNIMSERKSLAILISKTILDITDDDIYINLTNNHRNRLNRHVITFADKKRDIKIEEFTFKHIPASEIVPIDINYYHNIELDEFYILDTLVSQSAFQQFIEDRPKWSADNITNLLEENLVDKNYLLFNNSEEYITHISYYAAEAWCNWFNETQKIPEGFKVTLLEENMWYSVQYYNIIPESEAWQWTNNGFYLYDHFLTDDVGNFIDEFTQSHTKVVVGKNRYNDKIESGRGIQRADWCTPYLSFRPVLVPDEEI